MDSPCLTEKELVQAQIAAAYSLLTKETDIYEEQITPTGEVVHKKVGSKRNVTAADLQAASSTINSKSVQKYFAEQNRGNTVNVRKGLAHAKKQQKQLEVEDEPSN